MGIAAAFWILAIVAVVAALCVVIVRSVFRAALALLLCFVAVAGIFVTLSADFLAAIQILVYVGAVGVLIILAIMVTRDFQHGSLTNKLKIPAFIIAVVFTGVISYAMLNTAWPISSVPPQEPTTMTLAVKLFGEGGFLLPLEIAPILLLVAIIGAIVLVREK